MGAISVYVETRLQHRLDWGAAVVLMAMVVGKHATQRHLLVKERNPDRGGVEVLAVDGFSDFTGGMAASCKAGGTEHSGRFKLCFAHMIVLNLPAFS